METVRRAAAAHGSRSKARARPRMQILGSVQCRGGAEGGAPLQLDDFLVALRDVCQGEGELPVAGRAKVRNEKRARRIVRPWNLVVLEERLSQLLLLLLQLF